jgi:REP element-mobilizing transposase RayT
LSGGAPDCAQPWSSGAEIGGVTAPRPIVPGRTYLVTRRCTQREHLLRPDPEVTQIYEYCLGEAAQRHDIVLHAWTALSNHHHVVVTDTKGKLPAFLERLHKMVAKAMNARLGRSENFWAAEQASAVYLVEADDRLRKLVYVLANPVRHHLVERVEDWPGATSLAQTLSLAPKEVERPSFFRDDGPMPDTITLEPKRLEGFSNRDAHEWQRLLEEALSVVEASAREKRAADGRRVVGREQILRRKPTHRPTTPKARRRLCPAIACKQPARRRLELAELRGFRAAHRNARSQLLKGDRDVRFPVGTYRLREFSALLFGDPRVAAMPPPSAVTRQAPKEATTSA